MTRGELWANRLICIPLTVPSVRMEPSDSEFGELRVEEECVHRGPAPLFRSLRKALKL